jgi:hypothetical protein
LRHNKLRWEAGESEKEQKAEEGEIEARKARSSERLRKARRRLEQFEFEMQRAEIGGCEEREGAEGRGRRAKGLGR